MFNPFSSQVLDLNALKTVIICIWGSSHSWFPACLTSALGSIIRGQKEKERDVWTKGGVVWSLKTLKLEAWWVFWCFLVESFDLWFYLIFMDEKVLIFYCHLRETQLKVWFFSCFLWAFCWFGIGFIWCLCVCWCISDEKKKLIFVVVIWNAIQVFVEMTCCLCSSCSCSFCLHFDHSMI